MSTTVVVQLSGVPRDGGMVMGGRTGWILEVTKVSLTYIHIQQAFGRQRRDESTVAYERCEQGAFADGLVAANTYSHCRWESARNPRLLWRLNIPVAMVHRSSRRTFGRRFATDGLQRRGPTLPHEAAEL